MPVFRPSGWAMGRQNTSKLWTVRPYRGQLECQLVVHMRALRLCIIYQRVYMTTTAANRTYYSHLQVITQSTIHSTPSALAFKRQPYM